ncbi:MAG: aminodeoxychorismate lyase [Steroidobacteraceae bacterium]
MNGLRVDAGALLLDRGLHYGDGLFETIACRGRHASFLDEHLERLALGCRRLGIAVRSFGALRAQIADLAAGAERGLLKVIVTRGAATARGYAPQGDERPTELLLRYDWTDEDPRHALDGVPVRVADLALGENPRLAGLKHLNRLEMVLARADLAGSPFVEALLLSSSGDVVSGTFSNVFAVIGSRLKTPRVDRCGVAGVMRHVVMCAAAADGLAAEETRLAPADLDAATEIFLTNARVGIWPVSRLAARALGPGPVTRRLQRLLEPLLAGGA